MVYRFKLERDELEERLGGGIPEGSLVIIEGEYGSGKSVVMERLMFGLLKNKSRVSFVSTELTTVHFIEQMQSLDYPIEEFILDRNLLFLPCYPILGFRGNKADLIDRLLNAQRMYEADIIVIDAFSTLIKQYSKAIKADEGAITKRLEDVLYHFKRLNARGKTIFLTMEPGAIPEEVASVLKGAADIFFSLRIDQVAGTVSRVIFTRRFERAEKNVADLINFRVEPKSGLLVEIKSVS